MEEYSLGTIEGRFADIIWEKEPISMNELIKICDKVFGWKRTTTYTVLKRLSQKGIFQNEGGTVTSLLSKQDFYACQSEQYVESSFGGSLPGFLAAFTRRKKLSKADIEDLKKIIESCDNENI
ncbi:MAG TPA: BlaI/MecI/CopY family transcriptional regulator [Lachnospiraceae bacterium]|uniref:BlaI/MecI/CopY family transcriptional regulator n=1 Tax=Anaerosporobacter sp. TaxID=1872529 RepID=UPI000EE9D320|nr:BlaI/MecI/CopY family transcriptional regulator [Anaerosporobacter sp.]HAB59280.1 BlaI/MecI/CopY family transcriptional regulator [Lachnospiraceae bacterium]